MPSLYSTPANALDPSPQRMNPTLRTCEDRLQSCWSRHHADFISRGGLDAPILRP
jgi:hypothetical protein